MEPQVAETPYRAAVARRDSLEQQIRDAERAHAAHLKKLRADLARVQHQVTVADSGAADVETVQVATSLLAIQWDRPSGERWSTSEVQAQFTRAIADVQRGCPKMRERYFGVKAYAGWSSQEVDCEYGMAPSHGHVWFRIGLRSPRLADHLTDSDLQACVRWLNAVRSNPELLGP